MGWSEPKKFGVEKFDLGTKTGTSSSSTATYKISELLPDVDYTKLTVDDFIVGIIKATSKSVVNYNYWDYANPAAKVAGCTISKEYNAENGILTVKGLRQSLYAYAEGSTKYNDAAYQLMTVQAWLVC